MRSLRIEGAQQVKAADIKKKILTSETGWLPFSRKKYFDPALWRTDLRRIERYYRERGYYQAEVVSDEVAPRGKDGVDLMVKVKEGPPTFIARVSVTGLEELPPEQREAVLKDVRLREGQIFIEDEWEGLKSRLARTLRNLGYAAAQVEGQAKVDVATQRAEIDVRATPGPRYHFGELKLTTGRHSHVEAWRVLEQAEADVKPGDWYSDSAQAKAQERVFKLGVFGAVKVKPGEPDPRTETVPIIVDVREAPFHTVRAGIGVAVDPARTEARVLGGYTDRDFLGGLRQLTVSGNAGWAFLPTAYASATGAIGSKNGPIAKLTGELQQPRLLFRDLKLQVRLEGERGIEPAYSYFGVRGRVGVPWQPTPFLSITPSYNFEVDRLEEGQVGLGGTAPTLLFGCPRLCVLSFLEERVEWDRRDDKQEPRHGYYLSLSLQEGGGPLGGSFRYLRVMPEGRYYASFHGDRLTLSARLLLGTLQPASGNPLDSPIVARFYAGGANSMRGFGSLRLSPQYVVEYTGSRPNQYTGYTVPIGGNGLFESSFEARYHLVGHLVVATFVDTGFVTSESLRWNPGYFGKNMLYAVGVGLRYLTPVGPIRLDFAYRLPFGPPLQVYQPTGQTFTYASYGGCFGLGRGTNTAYAGAPEGACQIHFSIGEAF